MYCPTPFVASGGSCFYDCSQESGYRTQLSQPPRCIRSADATKGFDLSPVNPVVNNPGEITGTTVDTLPVAQAVPFKTERTRAKEQVAILNAELGKSTQLADAFKALQAAENARDQAPDAYQKARTAYYTLLKGDTWLEDEKKRIAQSEVDPEIQKYRNNYVSLMSQMDQQTQAYDTMQAIKDKVFRVKDDLTYSADLLMGQVQKIRSQIMLDRRKREEGDAAPAWFGWADTALNVLLVVALIAASWFVVQKLRTPAGSPPAFTEATSPT